MEYEIVRMEAAHVPQIAALERSAFPDPWSESSVASELDNPLSLWLVAQAGGEVPGLCGQPVGAGRGGYDEFGRPAGPPAAGGLPGRWCTALIRELAGGGVHSLTLEVRASNGPAQALYGSLGFVRVGCRREYYLSPKEDGEILRKEWDL